MAFALVKVDRIAERRRKAETWLSGAADACDIPGCGEEIETLGQLYRESGTPGHTAKALELLRATALQQVMLTLQLQELQEEAAAASQVINHYLDLFDFAPVAYFEVGFDGVILDANRASMEVFEKAPQDLNGTALALLFDAARGEELRDWLTRVRSAKFSERYRFEYQRPNRTAKIFQVVARLAPTTNSILVMFDDVTRSV